MRTFKCFDCGHISEVTEKHAKKIIESGGCKCIKKCKCTCHTMRVVNDNEPFSDILIKRGNGFNGSWDIMLRRLKEAINF